MDWDFSKGKHPKTISEIMGEIHNLQGIPPSEKDVQVFVQWIHYCKHTWVETSKKKINGFILPESIVPGQSIVYVTYSTGNILSVRGSVFQKSTHPHNFRVRFCFGVTPHWEEFFP